MIASGFEARHHRLLTLGLLVPTAVISVLPVLWLAIQSLSGSTTDGGARVTFDNYAGLFSDQSFRASVTITFAYAAVATVITTGLGFILAIAVRSSRFGAWLRSQAAIPFFIPPVGAALFFAVLVDADLGFGRTILWVVGADPTTGVLAVPLRAFVAVVIADAWQWMGVAVVWFWLALTGHSRNYEEQVRVDGGASLAVLRDAFVMPQWRSIMAFGLFKFAMTFADSERIDAITGGGGPHGALRVLGIWIARTNYGFGDRGYGAAAAVLLSFFVGLSLTGALLLARDRR